MGEKYISVDLWSSDKKLATESYAHQSNNQDLFINASMNDLFAASQANRNNSTFCVCSNQNVSTHNRDDSPIPNCKSLLLLRHAKSSWKNSMYIDDFDRHLSKDGIKVAHEVGRSLRKMNLYLPDVILSSPSVRTKETLNILMKEWIGWEEIGRRRTPHTISWKGLQERIKYDLELYNLADSGYLQYIVTLLMSDDIGGREMQLPPRRVMVVGHNPAMEDLLNNLATNSSYFTAEISRFDFPPGGFFEFCFPKLASWNDLDSTSSRYHYGELVLHLPSEK